MSYLLDTNVIIGILRRRHVGLLRRYAAVPRSDLCTSTIVKAELFYGSLRSAKPAQNRAVQERFLKGLPSHDFDDDAVEHYIRLRAALESTGTPIGSMDMLLAAIALANGFVLVTRNVRELSRVPGLQYEDWEV
jgi:tRNA(fMet)-specific endonuclease VapC